ncbi:MAG: helix-turn-helix transcriptional regulator [Clostridia bacterium]|nr:helix-turn-helix transcriptional regulator [Clostridia bacterium]
MSYNELKQHGTADFPIGYYQIDHTHPKYEMAYHWHAEHEIIRITRGVLDLNLNNRAVRAEAGDLIYVNSEVVHGAAPHDCAYECIVFSPHFFSMPGCDFFDGLTANTLFVEETYPHTVPENAELWDILSCAFDALNAGEPGYRYEVVGSIYRAFGWILSHARYSTMLDMRFGSARDEKNVRKLKNVLSFIRGAFDRPITLEEMADAAGVSPQYFCAFFKTMTGKSPFAYVNSYRIERACRKLLGTDLSVTDIAYSCGFNDLSYFIKTFKTEKGMTPRMFRRSTDR